MKSFAAKIKMEGKRGEKPLKPTSSKMISARMKRKRKKIRIKLKELATSTRSYSMLASKVN